MSGAADSVVVVQGAANQERPGEAQLAAAGEVLIEAAPARVLPENWPANAALQPDGSVILTLEWPVRFRLRETDGSIRDGDSYKELHLKRLKGKHKTLLLSAKDNVDFEKVMLACSAGIDAGKAELLHGEMDQSDIAAMLRVTRFFTTPGQKTGQGS